MYGPPPKIHPKHNNLLKIGAGRFFFNDSSSDLEGVGNPVNDLLTPGDFQVAVDNTTTIAGSYTRYIGDHFGIEIPLAPSVEIDAEGAASAEFVGNIGTFKALPLTAFANYYFTPRNAAVRPYLGLAVNHTIFTTRLPRRAWTKPFSATAASISRIPRALRCLGD